MLLSNCLARGLLCLRTHLPKQLLNLLLTVTPVLQDCTKPLIVGRLIAIDNYSPVRFHSCFLNLYSRTNPAADATTTSAPLRVQDEEVCHSSNNRGDARYRLSRIVLPRHRS